MRQELNYFVKGQVKFSMRYVEDMRELLTDQINGKYDIDVSGRGASYVTASFNGYVGMASEETLKETFMKYMENAGDIVWGEYVVVPIKKEKNEVFMYWHSKEGKVDVQSLGEEVESK